MVHAIQLLTKYCMGDKPIPFQIISDQKLNFVSGWGPLSHVHCGWQSSGIHALGCPGHL